ncbi:hypothetical protein LTR85_009184 [Meristemomyces frigidus]|nr:hypothetical protein LTR85_009184 [Meristemomyces frigidus]
MPISNRRAEGLDEIDVIICGGGVAACVVASRLAAAEPGLVILVIEGGENNDGKDIVVNPALFPLHLLPKSKTAVWYKANKSESLAGREYILPTGGILGGGSSINIMLYSRAQKRDFDSWNMPGWSSEEMMPFLKKIETYHGHGNKSVHGQSGPLQVTEGSYTAARSREDFLQAANQLGFATPEDLQDPKTDGGVEAALRTVTTEGKRHDAASAYLHPLLQDGQHPNLHVLCESKVVRVLFDENKRAIGVEYTPNPDYQITTTLTRHPRLTVKARKMVVVSCGALGTPLVLERSGVGSGEILEKASVPVVADVPGVGQDYQDHNLIFYPFETNLEPHETLDALWAGRLDPAKAAEIGLMGWNGVDVAGKIRPKDAEVAVLSPDFQAAWNRDYRNDANKPLVLFGAVSGFVGDPSTVPPGQYMSVAAYTAYPYSRGRVHITGPEWCDPVDFDTGFFTDENDIDLQTQVWAYKKLREIMRRTGMYLGELQLGHPVFPDKSSVATVSLEESTKGQDVTGTLRDLVYSAADDVAIEKHLRRNIGTTWHSLGTCKMAPREKLGVVNADLNVYGVQALKVVDLSVAPRNVAANTANTAYAIGEKGAGIIMRELGLVC